MPSISHVICLLDERSLCLLYMKQFEQCLVNSLPIEKSVFQEQDLLADFRRQYTKSKNRTKAYSKREEVDSKTGHCKNANLDPIIVNSSYPFIKYLQICKNGIIFMSIYSTAFADSSHMDTDLDCFQVFQYLEELSNLLISFLGKTINSRTVIENSLLINEVVEESMDFGIPQLSDFNLLQEYIKIKPQSKDHGVDVTDTEALGKEGFLSGMFASGSITKSNVNKFNLLSGLKDKEPTVDKKEDKMPSEDIYMKSTVINTLSDVINWRPKGIYYKKNELFVDVVEKIRYIQDLNSHNKQNVRAFELRGKIICKSYLSGMPFIKLGLINDAAFNIDRRIQLDQGFQFHQCVQEIDQTYYEKNSDNKLLKLIPPDGEFELCNYKFDLMNRDKKISHPPVIEIVSFTKKIREGSKEKLKPASIRINLQIKTYFKKNLVPEYLHIKVPITSFIDSIDLLDLTSSPKFKTDFGKLVFNLSDDFIVWECANIKGNYGERVYECFMQFQMMDKDINELIKMKQAQSMDAPPIRDGPKLEKIYSELHDKKDESGDIDLMKLNRNKIQIEFEIPYFISSGLKIDFIKIEEKEIEKYQFFSWIRYKTQSERNGYYVFADARG